MIAPAAMRANLATNMIIPPMMFRIAIIVTPVGRDFEVGCNGGILDNLSILGF
jgi:hypothetical protein